MKRSRHVSKVSECWRLQDNHGEALSGIVTATFSLKWKTPEVFAHPSYIAGLVVLLILGYVLVKVPLSNAGRPEDPAPPAVIV